MKIKIITASLLLISSLTMAQSTKEASLLIERVTKVTKPPIKLSIEAREDGKKYFKYGVSDNVLEITGSSATALTRGFYDYMKSNGRGMYTWTGSNLKMPTHVINIDPKEVVSPFQHHYYLNVCTFGYTTPYWDWARWEKEIDYMALHGVDMPLALSAYEAIISRVWRKLGLTESEISNFFSGPAHLPWFRMGNLSAHDGPLPQTWHEDQIELQTKILDRMRGLGMKPICPAFAGFVPQELERLYPDLKLFKSSWANNFHSYMLSPENELFAKIGKMFIKEWEKEFGKCEYYLADSFNEMEIPFPPKDDPARYEMISSYAKNLYNTIESANPDATWVMQGWMFGYQRDIWDDKTLAALLSAVPDDKMLLLDLAVDYNKHFWKSSVNWEFYKGFHDKQWVYSVIPNMGGKNGHTGMLEFYANGHIEALKSANKGNLVGFGTAPEGLENNEVIYELIFDAGWRDSEINIHQWLYQYDVNRYGMHTDEISLYWEDMLKSVYGTFTDHPRFRWQFRPGLINSGTVNMSDKYLFALENFANASIDLEDNSFYRSDLVENTAMFLATKAEILTHVIENLIEKGRIEESKEVEAKFRHIMIGMDRLLSTHPTMKLENWTNFAKKSARNPEQEKQYMSNARRIVTTWGAGVEDYSARIWSGLVRDYYLPRWEHFFAAKRSKTTFDFPKWEENWVLNSTPSSFDKVDNVVELAIELLNYSRSINSSMITSSERNIISGWNVKDGQTNQFVYSLTKKQIEALKTISITANTGRAKLSSIVIQANDKPIISITESKYVSTQESLQYDISLPKDIDLSSEFKIYLTLEGTAEGEISF